MKTKLFTTIVTVLVLATGMLFISAPLNVVSADSQVCENPGPYGICPPDTDITFGNITIKDNELVALAAVFGLGVIFLINSNLIVAKTLPKLGSHQ